MSRIGKQPVTVPDGVKISLHENKVSVTGPKGHLTFDSHPDMTVKEENGSLLVERPSDSASLRALHGTTRAVLANMVHGVTEGFTKELEIIGVGFNARLEGKRLKLALGFSHDIYFDPPEGIDIKVGKGSVSISGIDKQLVGQVAAKIRSFRPPEPYKGKGVRYAGEYVRIKKGKTVGE
ncbi:MAG: 50S ribosomal protein L6 [Candidatus Marinimicrobia bacterium]|nr:50S ribosomal protein L6 [Candidatus Neomarinimicrobiota bacterium]|tara:strand:+ start:2867 stop:3403 length:537 start_codon:yes stop_codon:yes gene_type:complete